MYYLLILLALFAIWLYINHTYSFWSRKGFPYIKPTIPFGNLDSVRQRQRSFGMAIYDLYEKSKEPFVGIYLMFRPGILIRDASLAHDILTKDFNSFHDRGIYVDEKNDPNSASLFALQGQKWKTLRSKLTPTFTSGKLKAMFPTIEATGTKMLNYVDETLEGSDKKVFEMKDLLSKYAVDIIGSVIFGLEVDSFKNPDNEFRAIGKEVNKKSLLEIVIGLSMFLCPGLVKFFKFFIREDKVADFMVRLVKETIEYREKNNVTRKDLMQLLMQLRNTGKINEDDTIWDVETTAESLKSMSYEEIAAQAFLFYIAGYETSASTSAYCMYELAQNPSILAKLIKEIDETLEKHNGKLSYEAVQEMKYLDLCIMETARKYPALPILNRECTIDYRVPGTKYTIEKGTAIIISLMGMHRDAEYFPDPLKFDPERFTEGTKNYNPNAYMPFGEGPRNCIAFRMGKVTAKVSIVMLLSKYSFEATQKKEMEFENYSVVLVPKGGINVNVSRR